MRFYTSGNFYPQLPRVIHDLPLDLLRSRTYPRNPEVIERGFAQLQAGKLPVFYAPARMGYSKWKTPPVQTGWGQNVISMLAAVRQQYGVIDRAQPHGLPIMDAIQAGPAVGANEMPMPTDDMDPNLRRGYVPLARNAVPLDDVVDVAAIDRIALERSDPEELRNSARVSALDEIGAMQDRLQMVAFANTGVPWFMR